MSSTRILVTLCLAAVVSAAVLAGAWAQTPAGQSALATKPVSGPATATSGSATVMTTVVFPVTPPLSQEEEQEALDYLKNRHPEYYQDLLKLKDTYPQKYQGNIRSIRFWIHSVTQIPEAIRDAYIVQQQCYMRISDLTQELRKVDEQIAQLKERMTPDAGSADQRQLQDFEASGQELKARIRKAVDARFDPDQVIREYRLEQLQKQISMMMDDIRQRDKQRSQLVDNETNAYVNVAAKSQLTGVAPTPASTTQPAPAK